jgi:hypothetical protein
MMPPNPRIHLTRRPQPAGDANVRCCVRSMAQGRSLFVTWLVLLAAMALVGFTGARAQSAEMTQVTGVVRTADRLDIFFSWSICGDSRIDTESNTATKDLGDTTITVPLGFTEEDKRSLFALADSISFWTLPSLVPPDTLPLTVGGPEFVGDAVIYLDRGRDVRHYVLWNLHNRTYCPEGARLEVLVHRIWALLRKQPAWASLPRSKRMCL